jgi:hypothetical protein
MTGRSPGNPKLTAVLDPLLNWIRRKKVPDLNTAGRAATRAGLAEAAEAAEAAGAAGAAVAVALAEPADGAAIADADIVPASASPAPTASARRVILAARRPLNSDGISFGIAILPLQEPQCDPWRPVTRTANSCRSSWLAGMSPYLPFVRLGSVSANFAWKPVHTRNVAGIHFPAWGRTPQIGTSPAGITKRYRCVSLRAMLACRKFRNDTVPFIFDRREQGIGPRSGLPAALVDTCGPLPEPAGDRP